MWRAFGNPPWLNPDQDCIGLQMQQQARKNLRLLLYLLFYFIAILFWGKEIQIAEYAGDTTAMHKFLGQHPEPPYPSQASITTAMQVFQIKKSPRCKYPQFKRDVFDRGQTIFGGLLWQGIVLIGPPAFSSWGMLGSTLAHEIEVHCNQNHLFYTAIDMIGLDGHRFAEEAAYGYEISNAKRFGLNPFEMSEIEATVAELLPRRSFLYSLVVGD